MKYQITHTTRFHYERPVRESFNEVRLKPLNNGHQTCNSFLLKVLPSVRLQHYQDFYGNWVGHFEIQEPHTSLLIEAKATVTTLQRSLLAPEDCPVPMSRLAEWDQLESCFDYLEPSHNIRWDADTWKLAHEVTGDFTDAWQVVQALMRWMKAEFEYQPLSTNAMTPMQEVLERRVGVCQDFSQVFIGMCRVLRIPARYVSGYLHTDDTSASHAWVEVLLPDLGWLGVDPTHFQQVDERYVKVGVGRDYSDVPPTRGHYKGTQQRRIEVGVEMVALELPV